MFSYSNLFIGLISFKKEEKRKYIYCFYPYICLNFTFFHCYSYQCTGILISLLLLHKFQHFSIAIAGVILMFLYTQLENNIEIHRQSKIKLVDKKNL